MKKIISVLSLATTASLLTLGLNAYAKDPTGDGMYYINDPVLISQFLGGNYKVSDLSALDYNQNGVITKADATQLQLDILNHCTPDPNKPALPKDSTTVEDITFNETQRHYSIYNAQTGRIKYMEDYYLDCAEEYFDNGISPYSDVEDRDDRVVDFSKTGVVKIFTEVEGEPHFGSGFIVGPHTIATAAHVVSNSRPYNSAIVKNILSFNADGTQRTNTITPLEIHVPSEFDITSSNIKGSFL